MLSYELNRAILRFAPRFEARDVAPNTFEALKSCSVLNIIPVWNGNSDNTIYGSPIVNFAFRAWHDSLHLKLNAPFSLEGEIYVANEQARILRNDKLGDIIIAEVKGQAEFFIKNGFFPLNQCDFVINYLKENLK